MENEGHCGSTICIKKNEIKSDTQQVSSPSKILDMIFTRPVDGLVFLVKRHSIMTRSFVKAPKKLLSIFLGCHNYPKFTLESATEMIGLNLPISKVRFDRLK